MLRIKEAVRQAREALACTSESPQLDAEVLLAHLLGVDRVYLIAHGDDSLPESISHSYTTWIARRASGEPVAYICGEKEFFGLTFGLNQAVLVPRPETELLVELALRFISMQQEPVQCLELGTGSGCITCSLVHGLKKEGFNKILQSCFIATDISPSALTVATQNACRHDVRDLITFVKGSWFEAVDDNIFTCIISNPPYVSRNAELAKDLSFEPATALFSDQEGLLDLTLIMNGAREFLTIGGKLFLECGVGQSEALQQCMPDGFEFSAHQDIQGILRVIELTRIF